MGWWFSDILFVSFPKIPPRLGLTEIVLKVALYAIKQIPIKNVL
jgi:hypothetical protein